MWLKHRLQNQLHYVERTHKRYNRRLLMSCIQVQLQQFGWKPWQPRFVVDHRCIRISSLKEKKEERCKTHVESNNLCLELCSQIFKQVKMEKMWVDVKGCLLGVVKTIIITSKHSLRARAGSKKPSVNMKIEAMHGGRGHLCTRRRLRKRNH